MVKFPQREKKGSPVKYIHEMIERGSLVEALVEAENRFGKLRCYDLWEKLSAINTDYTRLLDYYKSGGEDPERASVFAKLRLRMHEFVDEMRMHMALNDESSSQRERNMAKAALEETGLSIPALIVKYKEDCVGEDEKYKSIMPLVDALDSRWLTEADIHYVFEDLVVDRSTPVEDRAYALAALTHNIISRHNRSVTLALTDGLSRIEVEDAIVAREAVALVADMIANRGRWKEDETLVSSLAILIERRPMMVRVLRHVVRMFFYTKITLEIGEVVSVDLASQMGKIARNVMKKQNAEGVIAVTSSEIVEMFGMDKSVLSKIERVARWREEGADVAFVPFSKMKGASFFGSDMNWLRPFVAGEPHIVEALRHYTEEISDSLVRYIGENVTMCDSDKYSTIFNMAILSEQNMRMVKDHLMQSTEQIKAIMEERENIDKECDALQLIATGFICDLYRAFMLRGHGFGYTDIFEEQGSLLTSPVFPILYPTAEEVDGVGRFLVGNDQWGDAAIVYENLVNSDGGNVDYLRKYSLCLVKCGRTEQAIEYLKRAELVDDANVWTKVKLAESYVAMGRPSSALFYIAEVEQMKKLSHHQKSLKALCLKMLSRYDEALEVYREVYDDGTVDFELEVDMASCFLAAGKVEEGLDIVDALVNVEPFRELQLLKVEAYLIRHEIGKAWEEAKNVLQGMDFEELCGKVGELRPALRACGVKDIDVDLLLEITSPESNEAQDHK